MSNLGYNTRNLVPLFDIVVSYHTSFEILAAKQDLAA